MIDVPAYVQNGVQITNGTKVLGGTNWDLSRAAVPTPIVRVEDPKPIVLPIPVEYTKGYPAETGLDSKDSVLTLKFKENNEFLQKAEKQQLCTLPRGRYNLAAHASPSEKTPARSAQARVEVVAASLKRCGSSVVDLYNFGTSAQVPDGKSAVVVLFRTK